VSARRSTIWPDIEFRLHAVAVEHAAGHRVDQRYALADQLRHVLVAGGDQHLLAVSSSTARERADDVVGFDAADAQQRQALGLHQRQQRFDLRAQVVGHRRAM
jgi:hypothetical protein